MSAPQQDFSLIKQLLTTRRNALKERHNTLQVIDDATQDEVLAIDEAPSAPRAGTLWNLQEVWGKHRGRPPQGFACRRLWAMCNQLICITIQWIADCQVACHPALP